jgi:hypothetical protein
VTEPEQLMMPPTELEIAEFVNAANSVLTPKAVMIVRRLAFERGRLTDTLNKARSALLSAIELMPPCNCQGMRSCMRCRCQAVHSATVQTTSPPEKS